MRIENDAMIDRQDHRGTLTVKDPSNPILDTVRTKTDALREKLLATVGDAADDALQALLHDPKEAERTLGGVGIRERLFTTADYLRLCALTRQEREEALAEAISNPAARFAVTRILPSLSTIASGARTLSAVKEFASKLPWNETAAALRIRAGVWMHPDYLPELSGDNVFGARMHNVMEFFNDMFLRDEKYILRMVNGKSMVGGEDRYIETPGLYEIHEIESLEVPGVRDDNRLFFMYASTVYPTGLLNGNAGHWDTHTREAVIHRDHALAFARRLFDFAEHPERVTPEFAALGSYVANAYDLASAREIVERSTLLEEVTHGMNDMRKATPAGVRALNEARLSLNGLLRRISGRVLDVSSPLSQYSKEFSMLEECHAKLTKLIAGADPVFEILFIQSNFRNEAAGDYEHIAQLVCRYTGEESGDTEAMREHLRQLSTLPANELRLLAMHIYANEFNGSIEDTPFCTIDANGNLIRHAGTLDSFAAWA